MKRNFLTDITIVGATLVSRGGKILEYTIPNLLKWCDWILLMQDNINEETKEIVDKFKSKYPDRIRLAETGFPMATQEQENNPRGLFHRFKKIQGPIRETVLQYFRDLKKGGEKVDILIWPDEDEIFSDSFPQLLVDFWGMKDKLAITMKPVDVFGDLYTIHSRSMTGHTRILKLFDELTAIPYRTACYYRPLTKQNRIGSSRVLIHLASLIPEKREWRNKHWKPNARGHEALWKLPKEITKMTPQELHDILCREPDMTMEEYLRGGDKRAPVGVKNAEKAMQEASKMLDDIGVRHFLAFGTALGVYRDKKLIKWDWDVDFICLGEDIDKITVDVIIKYGFTEFKRKQDLPKWKNETGESKELYVRTFSFKKYGTRIDIDPAYISVDGKSRIILKGRKRQKFCALHPSEWFANPKKVEYNGKTYWLPNPTDKYLESNYRNTWKVAFYGPMPWEKRPCMSQYYECK